MPDGDESDVSSIKCLFNQMQIMERDNLDHRRIKDDITWLSDVCHLTRPLTGLTWKANERSIILEKENKNTLWSCDYVRCSENAQRSGTEEYYKCQHTAKGIVLNTANMLLSVSVVLRRDSLYWARHHT